MLTQIVQPNFACDPDMPFAWTLFVMAGHSLDGTWHPSSPRTSDASLDDGNPHLSWTEKVSNPASLNSTFHTMLYVVQCVWQRRYRMIVLCSQ